MPKFAANLSLLFTEVPFLDRFEKAHAAGFKAVECQFPYDFKPQELAQKLHQYNLQQVLFNMPPGDRSAGEYGFAALPGRTDDFLRSQEISMEYARALNCKKIHLMSGIVDKSYSRDEHIKVFIQNVRTAADAFAEFGIEVMIEPLNSADVPNYFIAHQREAADLINKIERPNVKLQFDFYHAQIMDGNLTRLIQDLGSCIGHVQIASVPERHEPFDGALDYPHLFTALKESGYDDWIGCEYNPRNSTEEGLSWANPYL